MAGALESNHTSVALKSILKGLHVATSGRKAERAARLAAHLAKNPELQSQPWAAAALTKAGSKLRDLPDPEWQPGGHGVCAPTADAVAACSLAESRYMTATTTIFGQPPQNRTLCLFPVMQAAKKTTPPTRYDAEVAARTARLEQQGSLASWAPQPCGDGQPTPSADVSAVSSPSSGGWSHSAQDDAALHSALATLPDFTPGII